MILNCMFKFEERFSVNSRDFVDLGVRRNFVDICVYEWDIFVGILGYLDLNEMFRRYGFE